MQETTFVRYTDGRDSGFGIQGGVPLSGGDDVEVSDGLAPQSPNVANRGHGLVHQSPQASLLQGAGETTVRSGETATSAQQFHPLGQDLPLPAGLQPQWGGDPSANHSQSVEDTTQIPITGLEPNTAELNQFWMPSTVTNILQANAQASWDLDREVIAGMLREHDPGMPADVLTSIVAPFEGDGGQTLSNAGGSGATSSGHNAGGTLWPTPLPKLDDNSCLLYTSDAADE